MSTTAPATTRTVFNYIGGEELDARGGETFAKRNPASGEVHSRVARSRAEDIQQAVSTARTAQQLWARQTVADRGATIRRWAQLLERDAEAVARIVATETGKAPGEAAKQQGARVLAGGAHLLSLIHI